MKLNFFSKDAAPMSNEDSATAVIRAAVWARRSGLANIARDCGVAPETMQRVFVGCEARALRAAAVNRQSMGRRVRVRPL